MNDTPITTAEWQPISYYVETDTMAVEIRPSPGREEDDAVGRDAGTDLVVHYAPDAHPWMWEIEHASRHPDHIAAAIAELRRQSDENGASSLARNPAQSTAYELFYRAMSERKQIFCTYDGYRRELCPIILGHSKGKEKALAFQFGGESKSGLPRAGEWRCLWLSRVKKCRATRGAVACRVEPQAAARLRRGCRCRCKPWKSIQPKASIIAALLRRSPPTARIA